MKVGDYQYHKNFNTVFFFHLLVQAHSGRSGNWNIQKDFGILDCINDLLLTIPSTSLVHPPKRVQSVLQKSKIHLFIENKAISQTEAGEEEKKQKAQHAAKIPLCITKSHFRHIRVMWPTISKIFIGYYSDKQIALEMSCLVHSGVFSPSFLPKFL